MGRHSLAGSSGRRVVRHGRSLESAVQRIELEWRAVMKNNVVRFLKDESGATAIEYGLIAALIAGGIISAAQLLGSTISNTFNNVGNAMK